VEMRARRAGGAAGLSVVLSVYRVVCEPYLRGLSVFAWQLAEDVHFDGQRGFDCVDDVLVVLHDGVASCNVAGNVIHAPACFYTYLYSYFIHIALVQDTTLADYEKIDGAG
jgi:hypothetical protein